jgi:hypothetical protein
LFLNPLGCLVPLGECFQYIRKKKYNNHYQVDATPSVEPDNEVEPELISATSVHLLMAWARAWAGTGESAVGGKGNTTYKG